MDSLGHIINSRNLTEPDEVTALKAYVTEHFNSSASVRLQRGALILSVPSSALAATLQLQRQKIIETCKLTQKLVIRTGS